MTVRCPRCKSSDVCKDNRYRVLGTTAGGVGGAAAGVSGISAGAAARGRHRFRVPGDRIGHRRACRGTCGSRDRGRFGRGARQQGRTCHGQQIQSTSVPLPQMRKALCLVAATLRGRPAPASEIPCQDVQRGSVFPRSLFFMDVLPQKKKPFGFPASLRFRRIAADSADSNYCFSPVIRQPPLIKVFGKRMGAPGGRRKALFQKGLHSSVKLSLFLPLFQHLTCGGTIRKPGKPSLPAHCRGPCRRQLLLQSVLRPP